MSAQTPSAMVSKYSASELKEMIIKCHELNYSDGLLIADVSPSNLGNMASLDPAGLDTAGIGCPIYTGPDLLTELVDGIEEAHLESWLPGAVKYALKDQVLAAEVCCLLDEELKECNLLALIGPTRTASQKAQGVASFRAKKGVVRLRQSGSLDGTWRGAEYRLQVMKLVDGHGGNMVMETLWFPFSQTFHNFLQHLTAETRSCRIPPLSIPQAYTVPRGWTPACGPPSFRPTDVEFTESEYESKALSLSQDLSTPSSATSLLSSINPAYKVREKADKGYTLADGPWVYRVRYKDSPWGGYKKMGNEEAYLNMIEELREMKTQRPGLHIAMVMHSKDRQAADDWDKKTALEAEEERRFVDSCEDMDSWDDSDDDKAGVPYVAWLMKSLEDGTM